MLTPRSSIIAAAGGGLNSVTPWKRPFSLLDLNISFPLVTEQVSTATLVVVGLVAPAVIIFLVVALLVPGPSLTKRLSRSQLIRTKLWEWEKGWAGLALSVAISFFVTQAAKNMFGKPRPDLLARCQPDLQNFAAHVVGGFGQDISPRWTLVSASICTNPDTATVTDGFRSFPSGHSSFSWSGLFYLSLFLCAKLGVQVPYRQTDVFFGDGRVSSQATDRELLPLRDGRDSVDQHAKHRSVGRKSYELADMFPVRHQAAAPPVYLLVIAFIPIAVAFYITSTRYVQFFHFGFDIISGSLIGILSSYLAFRWYHLPAGREFGWTWGARSPRHAFGIGFGVEGYVHSEGSDRDATSRPHEPEAATV